MCRHEVLKPRSVYQELEILLEGGQFSDPRGYGVVVGGRFPRRQGAGDWPMITKTLGKKLLERFDSYLHTGANLFPAWHAYKNVVYVS